MQNSPNRNANWNQQRGFSPQMRPQSFTPKFEHQSRGFFNIKNSSQTPFMRFSPHVSNSNFNQLGNTSPYSRESRSPYDRNENNFQKNFHRTAHNKKSDQSSIEEYFKPSMLENPWRELEDCLRKNNMSKIKS
nr:uncharacterized protein LOC124807878 [Hydra vulgaris]